MLLSLLRQHRVRQQQRTHTENIDNWFRIRKQTQSPNSIAKASARVIEMNLSFPEHFANSTAAVAGQEDTMKDNPSALT